MVLDELCVRAWGHFVKLLVDRDYEVAKWVALQIDPTIVIAPDSFNRAIGVLGDLGQLVGGIVYTNYFKTDIEVWMAGYGRWVTPFNFRVAFRYPFYQLGCQRVTALTKRKNKKVKDLLVRMHFSYEGIKRKFYPDGQDAAMYGLLKEEYEQHWEHKSFVNLLNLQEPPKSSANVGEC